MVEHKTLNLGVAGSSPARGLVFYFIFLSLLFPSFSSLFFFFLTRQYFPTIPFVIVTAQKDGSFGVSFYPFLHDWWWWWCVLGWFGGGWFLCDEEVEVGKKEKKEEKMIEKKEEEKN